MAAIGSRGAQRRVDRRRERREEGTEREEQWSDRAGAGATHLMQSVDCLTEGTT